MTAAAALVVFLKHFFVVLDHETHAAIDANAFLTRELAPRAVVADTVVRRSNARVAELHPGIEWPAPTPSATSCSGPIW